jgi:hypothetical protein
VSGPAVPTTLRASIFGPDLSYVPFRMLLRIAV